MRYAIIFVFGLLLFAPFALVAPAAPSSVVMRIPTDTPFVPPTATPIGWQPTPWPTTDPYPPPPYPAPKALAAPASAPSVWVPLVRK